MKTPSAAHRRLPLAIVLAASLALAACSSGAAGPSGSVAPSAPDPTPVGGGSSGAPGGGTGIGVDPGLPVDPGTGQASLVVPRPGQLNPHPVAVTELEPAVDGRRVIVRVTWWSGVEPCHVLDSVRVDRSGSDIVLTVLEGTGDPNVACIEIAQQKATIVDLGELEPGTYTISAPGGEAPPVTVTVA